eukprot:SAG31_NODE_39307_length_289_cov_0.821053_1_plen_73_part_01
MYAAARRYSIPIARAHMSANSFFKKYTAYIINGYEDDDPCVCTDCTPAARRRGIRRDTAMRDTMRYASRAHYY